MVSVIIPVFNGEAYLRDCLDNILGQSYTNLDVIVVNDGSTDNSLMIASEYPVRIINLPRNRGLSVARNSGIDHAKGEYIHFMDVDDQINTGFYQEMVKAIKETGAEIACSGMVNEPKPHRTMLFKERLLLTTINDKLNRYLQQAP